MRQSLEKNCDRIQRTHNFHGFRFENKSTEVYLSLLLSKLGEQSGPYLPGTLEIAHRNAFRSTAG